MAMLQTIPRRNAQFLRIYSIHTDSKTAASLLVGRVSVPAWWQSELRMQSRCSTNNDNRSLFYKE